MSRAGTEDRDMAGNEISGFVLSGNSPECCGGGANKNHARDRESDSISEPRRVREEAEDGDRNLGTQTYSAQKYDSNFGGSISSPYSSC